MVKQDQYFQKKIKIELDNHVIRIFAYFRILLLIHYESEN